MRTSVFLHLQKQRSALRKSASAGRASRAWSMNESVEAADLDVHELATIRVRTMYGCVFAVPLPRRHCETHTPAPAKTSLQKYTP